MGTYTFGGTASHIYKVTVETTGTYDIVAYGGSGGKDLKLGSIGGSGAEIGDQVTLQAGEKLEIIVGGAGIDGAASGGGGGGTFVLANTGVGGAYVPLIVAGGGGGGSGGSGSGYNGGAASYANAAVNSSARGAGGDYRFGGAGFKASGGSGGSGPTYAGGSGGSKGPTYSGGGGGGGGGLIGGAGGFGGGGGGGGDNGFGSGGGGGGGGYSGGRGGTAYRQASGGGTSFDSAGTPTIAKNALAAGQNGNGFVTITPSVTCYVTGTLIRTARDQESVDVAVESLAVGDLVLTASGEPRPITWIAHRDVDCAAFDAPYDAWPIRILAGAFGIGSCGCALPARDLWLSPGHPVLVGSGSNEYLVPIMCLINGTSVRRVAVDTVTYWHIELDTHDILLARACRPRASSTSATACGSGRTPRRTPWPTPTSWCRAWPRAAGRLRSTGRWSRPSDAGSMRCLRCVSPRQPTGRAMRTSRSGSEWRRAA